MGSNEQLMAQFVEATENGDLAALDALVHDEVVMNWPQSGERFIGKQNALAAMQAQEVKPQPAGDPRMLDGGDFFVMLMPLRYGDEIYHYVGVFETRDGKIARSTEYFGAPFPPEEFRAQYAEK